MGLSSIYLHCCLPKEESRTTNLAMDTSLPHMHSLSVNDGGRETTEYEAFLRSNINTLIDNTTEEINKLKATLTWLENRCSGRSKSMTEIIETILKNHKTILTANVRFMADLLTYYKKSDKYVFVSKLVTLIDGISNNIVITEPLKREWIDMLKPTCTIMLLE